MAGFTQTLVGERARLEGVASIARLSPFLRAWLQQDPHIPGHHPTPLPVSSFLCSGKWRFGDKRCPPEAQQATSLRSCVLVPSGRLI